MAAGRSAWRPWPAALSEERDTLEEVIEPFVIQKGLIQRTPRGRVLSEAGFSHLGITPPRRESAGGQFDLLNGSEGA